MAHSPGYYTSYTPGDGGVLEDMEDTYGAKFERLNRAEKLCLISMMAADLAFLSTEPRTSEDLFSLMLAIKGELAISDREGLVECLINGVRNP
ncbi:hypothetical protein [Nostoc sp.]|uniref:hypothetical protein n=1 Tax=Nostoc sp. TaxID=1180 RepID=UPI002FF7B03F